MNNETLIVIENNVINFYPLKERKIWKVGRSSKGNEPDIKLSSPSVSRKHGKFQNLDGYWFY
ncbi:MAG: FHA domain-containing protein, partial [Lachnospiraceae bacterium]|nr:FHA domain-containing protein [Lachnospiraceae bacterium]